jgi:hypothetical protein
MPKKFSPGIGALLEVGKTFSKTTYTTYTDSAQALIIKHVAPRNNLHCNLHWSLPVPTLGASGALACSEQLFSPQPETGMVLGRALVAGRLVPGKGWRRGRPFPTHRQVRAGMDGGEKTGSRRPLATLSPIIVVR